MFPIDYSQSLGYRDIFFQLIIYPVVWSKKASMIILVAGLPGSGKSYFASRLAAQLAATYISSDKVRKSIHGLGKYDLEDKLSIYKAMVDLAEDGLRKDEWVVLDATFYLKSMRSLFYSLADKHSAAIYFIYIKAMEDLIMKRVSGVRPDSEADFEVYKKVKGEFEAIDFPHLILESTDNNITEMIHQSKEYIHQ